VKVSLLLPFNTNANTAAEPPKKIRRKTVDLRVHVVATKERVVAFLLEQGA
jgi:hypothetical protein